MAFMKKKNTKEAEILSEEQAALEADQVTEQLESIVSGSENLSDISENQDENLNVQEEVWKTADDEHLFMFLSAI